MNPQTPISQSAGTEANLSPPTRLATAVNNTMQAKASLARGEDALMMGSDLAERLEFTFLMGWYHSEPSPDAPRTDALIAMMMETTACDGDHPGRSLPGSAPPFSRRA